MRTRAVLKRLSTALVLCAPENRAARYARRPGIPSKSLCGFDTQLFERRHDVRSVRPGIHLLVDVQDFAIFANVKRPAERKFPFRGDNTIVTGHLATRIAEDGVVQFE